MFDNHGHILTNNHVVENSEKIEVTFYDGVTASAKVVGTDKESDVAVIKVENTSYPALPKGNSDNLKVGELVMAIGSPFELSQTVTTGIISALERNTVGINNYESFIQTDAPINRGNSGGPLVNMNGEVIGINSAIVSGSSGNDGIGFAIPIKMAVSVADMLVKDGKVHYARIGIALSALSPALNRQLGLDEGTKGVLVDDVVSGSPADKAGLKAGDVITSFGGEKIQNGSSFRLKVATSEVSKSHEIGFIRDGKPRTAQIVPAPAENVVFEQERGARSGNGRSESDRARQDHFQCLRPRGPDVDSRAGQAAWPECECQGGCRVFGQGRQSGRGRGDSGRRRDHEGHSRPQVPTLDERQGVRGTVIQGRRVGDLRPDGEGRSPGRPVERKEVTPAPSPLVCEWATHAGHNRQ